MKRFFSYCPDCGLEDYATAEEAEKSADGCLDHFRDDAPDGWSEEVYQICWGEIKGVIVETERRPFNPETDFGIDPDCKFVVDYGIVPIATPETFDRGFNRNENNEGDLVDNSGGIPSSGDDRCASI